MLPTLCNYQFLILQIRTCEALRINSRRVPSSSWMSQIWDIPRQHLEQRWQPATSLLGSINHGTAHWRHHLSPLASPLWTICTRQVFSSIRHHAAFSTHWQHPEILPHPFIGSHMGGFEEFGPTLTFTMMFRRVIFSLAFISLFFFFFSFFRRPFLSTWCYATGGSLCSWGVLVRPTSPL